MKSIKVILIVMLLATVKTVSQNWTLVPNLPVAEFTAVSVIDGTVFTASGNTLYYSSDNGVSWMQKNIFPSRTEYVTCFKKFNNVLYVGTSKGLFYAPFTALQGTWSQQLPYAHISSFTQRQDVLYASTEGSTIFRLQNNNWIPFANGLPNYSYNVSRIINTPGPLLATAGANGTFYKYNFTANTWIEDYYNGTYNPGLDINDIVLVGNTLFASRRNRMLRSDDFGDTWISDQLGLINGHYRTLTVGKKDLYSLTKIFTGDANITRIQKRKLGAPLGSQWSASENFPAYVYELCENGSTLYIATNEGFFSKVDATLGTDIPGDKKATMLWSTLSNDGKFYIQSITPIDDIAVYDLSGKQIKSSINDNGAIKELTIGAKGMFIVRITCGDKTETFKLINK